MSQTIEYKFKTYDNYEIIVNNSIAMKSNFIKGMIDAMELTENETNSDIIEIPLITNTSCTLDVIKKLIEFYEYYNKKEFIEGKNEKKNENDINKEEENDKFNDKNFNTEYCNISNQYLFDVLLAAHYLDMPEVIAVGCKKIAGLIEGKNPHEIKKMFNDVKNDFSEQNDKDYEEYIKNNPVVV